MKNILLFGGSGFIGSHLKEGLIKKGYKVSNPRIEIRNLDDVRKTIEEEKPDYIINATGMTGRPNVDWCESHPMETYSVNVGGSLNIASAALEKGITVAQMSSGCVYEGDNNGKGWTENDKANYFGSMYSRSRIACEMILKDFPNVLQLRIRIPILGKSNPKNLIDKLIKYPKMINIINSCTVIEDFVPATIKLIEMKTIGIVNMTNPHPMDHKSIMSLYKEIVDPSFEMNFMEDEEQSILCERRSNCVLSSEKREKMGIHMPPLEESLKKILLNYKKEKELN